MKGYVKIIILVLVFAALLGAVWAIQQSSKRGQREIVAAQKAQFFPGLEAGQVFRIEVNSLQDGSLLLRKQAGTWEVTKGRDIIGELMSQTEDETEPEEEPAVEESEEGEESPPEELEVQEEEQTEESSETEEAEQEKPLDPKKDTGPAGDPFRTFYKADPDKVEGMVESIAELQRGRLVTSDPEKQTQLKVLNHIVGTEVIFYNQEMNQVADLIIGDHGAAFSSCYVRASEEDEVYEVQEQLKMIFGTTVENLRDRTIFQAAPETITTVAIHDHNTGNELSFIRSEGIWEATDASGSSIELDAAKVDDLMTALGSLSANSFPDTSRPPMPPGEDEEWDESDPWGLMNPVADVEFTTSDNVPHSLVVGRQEGSTYYAVADGRFNDVFKVSKPTVDGLLPSAESLAPSEGAVEISGEEVVQDLEGVPVDRSAVGSVGSSGE